MIGTIRQNNKLQTISTKTIKYNGDYPLDVFSKTAILTVLTGYMLYNDIKVNDKFTSNVDLGKLSSFITYILNHPEFAPQKFNINLSDDKNYQLQNKKNINNDFDCILSFSGGIDSTAGLLYALDKNLTVQPLWVDFGQRNNKSELNAVNRVLQKLNISPLIIKMDIKKYILDGWKVWDFIIPGRNFLFVCLANNILNYSSAEKSSIYLCAHRDEMLHRRNTDKSQHFFNQCSKFFTENSNKKIIVNTPFPNVDKTQVLYYWRKYWLTKYNISPHDTTTCYYGRGCGKCEACLKRTICLLASGFNKDPFMKINPMRDPNGLIAKKWIPKMDTSKLSRIRKLDLLIAIERSIDIVSHEIKQYYSKLPYQTLGAIKNRKREIELVRL